MGVKKSQRMWVRENVDVRVLRKTESECVSWVKREKVNVWACERVRKNIGRMCESKRERTCERMRMNRAPATAQQILCWPRFKNFKAPTWHKISRRQFDLKFSWPGKNESISRMSRLTLTYYQTLASIWSHEQPDLSDCCLPNFFAHYYWSLKIRLKIRLTVSSARYHASLFRKSNIILDGRSVQWPTWSHQYF